jgi:hypothetical protein
MVTVVVDDGERRPYVVHEALDCDRQAAAL